MRNKSKHERALYTAGIRKRHVEPTVDEELDFDQSDDPKEDLSTPVPERRPISSFQRLKDHVWDNGAQYIGAFAGALVIGLMLYLVINSNYHFGNLDTNVVNINKEITGVKDEQKEIKGKLESHTERIIYMEARQGIPLNKKK